MPCGNCRADGVFLAELHASGFLLVSHTAALLLCVGVCSAYRPYPIMMGAILLQDTPLGFYPFEVPPCMTPVLTG